MTAARIACELVEDDAGQQPAGGGPGATGAAGVTWHVDKTRRWHSWHVHLLPADDTTVSQTLRHPRAAEVVTAARDGRVIRYQLADGPVAALLGP